MSKARIEILQMIAEGKVSPEDGARLLDALDDGDAGATKTGNPRAGRAKESAKDAAENLGRAFEDAARAVKSAAQEGVRAAQKVFDEHRPETELVRLENGAFEVPEGGTLRIQPAFRVSIGGGSAGGAVTVRGIPGAQVRVLEGSAVEVHKNEGDYILTWAKSALVVEVPATLARLVVRSFGNVTLSEFGNQFRIESFGGNVSALGASAPFKIRALGGSVRIRDLALREGTAAVRATGGDIDVIPTEEASVEIHAAATLGGRLQLPKGAVRSDSKTRRKGVVVLGEGKSELELDALSGWVRVHADHLEDDPDADQASNASRASSYGTASGPGSESEFGDEPTNTGRSNRTGSGSDGEGDSGSNVPKHDATARPAPPKARTSPDEPSPGADLDDDDPDPWTVDWYDDRDPGGSKP
ncbi:MAG: hypothetical protein KDA27_16435 [Candidatus Eisenbacteria bacterium]|uniref:YvlB/LiaX N-terminal domain-containing protein n=1 Tax=Eiseniibacteriota bacterium TaxID=2212470 RepID=A0A956NE48_UNCEI|nr:hypothetical protein [Candidatus Eisenbacteria bacterium]